MKEIGDFLFLNPYETKVKEEEETNYNKALGLKFCLKINQKINYSTHSNVVHHLCPCSEPLLHCSQSLVKYLISVL